jgi:hypothetical protein
MLINTAIRQMRPLDRLEYYCPEAIAFQIIDRLKGGSARGDYSGDLAGLVRPKLNWNTDRVGDFGADAAGETVDVAAQRRVSP